MIIKFYVIFYRIFSVLSTVSKGLKSYRQLDFSRMSFTETLLIYLTDHIRFHMDTDGRIQVRCYGTARPIEII